jgi:DNA-binding transcriptional ArsR family regulator
MNDNKCISACTASGEGAIPATEKKTDKELAALAKALAHPARIQILRILAQRTACVCGDIVVQVDLAQSTVSEHLRILKQAGLIIGEVSGPRVCYCIDPAVLRRFNSLLSEFVAE